MNLRTTVCPGCFRALNLTGRSCSLNSRAFTSFSCIFTQIRFRHSRVMLVEALPLMESASVDLIYLACLPLPKGLWGWVKIWCCEWSHLGGLLLRGVPSAIHFNDISRLIGKVFDLTAKLCFLLMVRMLWFKNYRLVLILGSFIMPLVTRSFV